MFLFAFMKYGAAKSFFFLYSYSRNNLAVGYVQIVEISLGDIISWHILSFLSTGMLTTTYFYLFVWNLKVYVIYKYKIHWVNKKEGKFTEKEIST